MKQLLIAISIMACGSATVLAKPPCSPVEDITMNITANRTLFSNVLYRIQGCISVNNNATLTIQPGTVITFGNGDYLILEKDSKINAAGTATNPIVFTSAANPGSRVPLTNAGVILCGKGQTNESPLNLPCSRTYISGTDNTDNSGTMSYVQFHYLSGTASLLLPYMDNALTLIGVGSATTINNIEITNSLNNGLAALGGEPLVNNAYALDNRKNQVYAGLGTQMELVGLLAMTRDAAAHQSAGTNGMLIENNRVTTTATPWTDIKVNNSSFIGPKHCDPGTPHPDFKNGIVFDNNGGGDIYNTVITGFNEHGLFITDAASATRTANDQLNFSYNSMTNNGSGDYDHGALPWSGCGNSMAAWISGPVIDGCEEEENQFDPIDLKYDISICNDYCIDTPIFKITGATGLEPADASTKIYDLRGAVQINDLYSSWVKFCPQNEAYCEPVPTKNTFDKKASLIIIPNPAKGQATLEFNSLSTGLAKVTIFDKVTSRVLFQKDFKVKNVGNQNIPIRLNGLNEGVYPIRVEMKDTVINGMISVQ